MTCVVIDRSLAAAVGEESPAVRVIHRDAAPRRPWRTQGEWRSVSPDGALSALAGAPDDAVALVRLHEADPGAACIAQLARMMKRPVLTLPEPFDAAVWVVALAVDWCTSGLERPDRAIAVACGVADGHGTLPRTARHEGTEVPDLHPRVLGRWASRAFSPCGWCAAGGGLPGAPCATCGERVAVPARPDINEGARVVPLRRIA
jgi:hypothetical protein